MFVGPLFLRLVSPEASKCCDFADDIKMKRFFFFILTFFFCCFTQEITKSIQP